jgi:steroid 5-alpha reductase family enzyme
MGAALIGLRILLFAVGFGFEGVGDAQLQRFRAEPGNRGQAVSIWESRPPLIPSS